MKRMVLWAIAALALVPELSVAQQSTPSTHIVTWTMFGLRTNPSDPSVWTSGEREPESADAHRGLGTVQLPLTDVLARMVNPQATALAMRVTVDKLSVSVAAPLEVSPALSQSYRSPQFSPGSSGGFRPSGMYDGLVQFVSGVRLNVGTPDDAHLGFSWNIHYAPGGAGQNGTMPDIGLAIRWRSKF